MSYLGKISAIVSANTADFSSRLGMAGKDFNAWARSLTNTISQTSTGAAAGFRNIYTEKQKLDRALAAAQTKTVAYKGFEAKDLQAATNRVRALYSVMKEVTGPGEAAARSISKMSSELQAAFTPATERSQRSAERLRVKIDKLGENASVANLGKTFQTAARQAELLVAATERVKSAEQLAGGLATGRELRFRNPEYAQQMARAQAAQETAATTQGGNFSGIIQRQAAAAKELSIAFARMEAARLTKGGDIKGATAAYQQQLSVLMAITAELEKATDRTDKRARSRDLTFSLTGVPQNLAQAEQSYSKLVGKVQELSSAQRKAFAGNLRALGGLIDTKDETKLRDVRSLIKLIERDLAKQFKIDIAAEEARQKIDDLKRRLGGVSETLTGKSSDPFTQLERSANSARQAVDKVADSRRKAALDRRVGRIEADISSDRNDKSLTPRQLESRARLRSRQLDRVASTAGAEPSSTDMFGSALNSKSRNMDLLRGNITSIKSSLDTLPASLRSGFVPAIREAEKEFARLSALGPAATARQIQAATQRVQQLGEKAALAVSRFNSAQAFQSNFGGAGAGGLNLGIDQKTLGGVGAQIEYLQGRLAGLGATARGPVVAAMERVRQVAVTGFRDGTIGTQAFGQQLRNATNDLTRVAAAALNIRPQRLAEQLRRVGDIARGSFGNLGLAVQQAAFAVDDFFSVTGGLDQRIRAAGNNISQLAFIIGRTKGLIIGIAISIGAQLVAAYIKWANKGKKAEDQLKALNDAMERQKTLAKELSDALRNLTDSIVDGMFTGADAKAREFSKKMDEIIKKGKEARQEFLAELNPGIIENRVRQATVERQIQEASTPGERLRLQAELAQLKQREKEIKETPQAATLGVYGAIEKGFRAFYLNGVPTTERFKIGTDMAAASYAKEQTDKALERVRSAGSPEEAIAIVRELQDTLRENRGTGQRAKNVDDAIAALQQLERVITEGSGVSEKTSAAIVQFVNSLNDASSSISAAQELLGDFEFSPLRKEISETSAKLAAATQAIQDADRAFQESTTKTLEEAQARDAVVAEQNKVIEALKEQAAAQRVAAVTVKNFDAVMKRVAVDLANTVSGEARSFADRARREDNRAAAAEVVEMRNAGWGEFGFGGERRRAGDIERERAWTAKRRADAEEAARRAEQNALFVTQETERLRMQFEEESADDPEVQKERASLAIAQKIIDDPNATPEQKLAAQQGIDSLLRKQRLRFEDSPQGRRAAEVADNADRRAAEWQEIFRQEDERRRAAMRGRDIGIKDSVLAARDAENKIKDLAAARDEEMLGAEGAMANRLIANAQASEFARQQMRSAAPAIFEMADAVTNAVLQGPSRQALEVTDVSTMEGSRELNRLLRGDDASKNANIVELQKQNATLTEIKAALQEAAQNAGIVLDLRG